MKLILIFLALCINLYANLVTTNGKIGLYFDESEMRIHSIKGSVFEEPDISILDVGVLIDNKPYLLNEHIKSARILSNTNIIMVVSEVADVKFATFIFPSVIDREKLYINTVIRKAKEETTVKLLYRVYPYKNINILDYNSPKDYYVLDDFRIKSLNNPMGMYLSNQEFMEELKFKEVRERTVTYQDEKLLLASEIKGNSRRGSDILILNFGSEKWKNRIEYNPGILRDEYTFWKEWNWDFQGYPKEVREQLTQLKMITMGFPIPRTLSYTASEQQLTTNMKLSTLLANYGKDREALAILRNYRFSRKNTAEDVAILTSLVKSWEYSKDVVGETYIRTTIYPIFQRILAGIDDEGRFQVEEDRVETYFYLITVLEDVLEDIEAVDYVPKETVEKKLALLRQNVEKNYMTPDGLKDTPTSLEANPKNIAYLNLYPKDVRRAILDEEYKKYYNSRFGFLMFPGEEYVDTDYNLTFARQLFDNSFEQEGEMLFARVREMVNGNNNYITPRMYPTEKNEAGIYGDLIFSYLITNYFRGIE